MTRPRWLALLVASFSCFAALAAPLVAAEPLAGCAPLETPPEADLAWEMVQGIHRYLDNETAASLQRRAAYWQRNFSSPQRYNASVEPNRRRLARILGAVDPRVSSDGLELLATTQQSALVGRGQGFEVYAVRWPAIKGIEGEGLLLKPTGRPHAADVIALADADHSPEMLAGLVPGIAPESQFARRLAESGCRVVVPLLLDRDHELSVAVAGTFRTRQPHREFIYRQAFELGRHVIGYEVQKVLALVDWFTADSGGDAAIGIIGHGEGGLLALNAAALDPRIDAACVSGYFDSRQQLWQEPIYRNVFGLLEQFGDAELASLIAPRPLVIEAARGPEIAGRPLIKQRHQEPTTPGTLATPVLASVRGEVERARQLVAGLPGGARIELVVSGDGHGPPGSDAALAALLAALAPAGRLQPAGASPAHLREVFAAGPRRRRQFDQMVDFTQALLAESQYVREAFWAEADRKSRSVERWVESTGRYRRYFYDEVIGRFDRPLAPPRPRCRQIYDEPLYTGYEVVLDVFAEVIAYGILLVPKDIQPGQRRPVVVCQHGLEGRPQELTTPGEDHRAYHRFAGRLAERGFVTYSPQNPYIFQDYFRALQRKANPLGKTLFSIIVPQHQQTVDWLASLPMVDPDRIAFYGLSYGGKTAMRVPALVDRYALSICSGDFNEWIWKNASVRGRHSYLPRLEYEMFEFDLGQTFNYAEMAGLICPRPFMVERGHRDGVAPDEQVAYEYAKVRLLYADLNIADRTEIEYFDGPHTIHGVGTFDFLHRHLDWPAPSATQ